MLGGDEVATGRVNEKRNIDLNHSVEHKSESRSQKSSKMTANNNDTLIGQKTSSKMRNGNFLEYVVGGDSLLPKRVRSRRSDLPYSN